MVGGGEAAAPNLVLMLHLLLPCLTPGCFECSELGIKWQHSHPDGKIASLGEALE